MADLKDSFELYDGTGAVTYGTTWRAQTFTTGSTYTITDVALYCWKYGSPGNITVSIRATDEDGKPTESDLCSVTVADSEISTLPAMAWYTFTFDTSYVLDDATKYAIVWRAPSGDAGNYFTVFGYDSAGYANGDYAYSGADNGTTWNFLEPSNRDINFRTYGTTTLPGVPITPSPGHTDTEVDFSGLTLSWVNGGDTDTYDVWIGDSVELNRVSIGQEGTSYVTTLDEISSAYDDKIYWAIDAINDFGTTEGDTWNFDARPGQVSTFTPLNGATGLTLSEVGSTWDSPSANTDTYDVYFGIESGSLVYVGNTVDLLLDLVGIFPTYNHTYYWEIDAVNDFGVTLGNEVSFATISFYPPLPTGVTLDGDGNPTGTPTGVNNMITIRKLVVAANSKIWYESI